MVNFDTIVPNSHTYKLTTNYRSTKLIVDMANDSIEWNSNRVEKTMKSAQLTQLTQSAQSGLSKNNSHMSMTFDKKVHAQPGRLLI